MHSLLQVRTASYQIVECNSLLSRAKGTPLSEAEQCQCTTAHRRTCAVSRSLAFFMEYAACLTFERTHVGQSAEARRFSDQSHRLRAACTLRPHGRRIVGASAFITKLHSERLQTRLPMACYRRRVSLTKRQACG